MKKQLLTNSQGEKLPDPTEVEEGKFAKSQATRTRILQAAVECLAELGYTATSTTVVAKRAGMSRTAMLYHFQSRRVLIDAVVQYVTKRRVELQDELQAKFPRNAEFRDRSVDSIWEQLQTTEFLAFCELSMVARTDQELAEVFQPSLAAFDKARQKMARRLAEPEMLESVGFDLRRDVTRFLLEGVAQQNGITFNKARRMKQITTLLKYLWSDDSEELLEDIVERAKSAKQRPPNLN